MSKFDAFFLGVMLVMAGIIFATIYMSILKGTL